MQSAIVLAQHYAAEALRLFGASPVGGDLRLAQRVLQWLREKWNEPAVSLPDLYQLGPNPSSNNVLSIYRRRTPGQIAVWDLPKCARLVPLEPARDRIREVRHGISEIFLEQTNGRQQ
jgi:hypothetical protein